MGKLFGTDGIRGIVGENLTVELAFHVDVYKRQAQYRAVKAQEKAPQPVKAPEKKGDTRPPRGNRSQQAARRQLTICETGISKLEAECRRLDEEMAAHACDAGELNRLYQEKQEVEARLEQEMARCV